MTKLYVRRSANAFLYANLINSFLNKKFLLDWFLFQTEESTFNEFHYLHETKILVSKIIKSTNIIGSQFSTVDSKLIDGTTICVRRCDSSCCTRGSRSIG